MYSFDGVNDSTEHDDLRYIIMIAAIPKVFNDFLDRRLCKDRKDLIIKNWFHEAGVDVEFMNVLNFYEIMLVLITKGVHAWILLYLSFPFYP
jgi:CRISPR/Cas system-associated endonuclease/helicase Cas3